MSSTPDSDAASERRAGEPLETWRGFTLNEFQVRAVAAIRAGKNVLVGAPTGAGKTLVAEYAIHDAVARGRRSVYTAPIKALSNQKFRDFRAERNWRAEGNGRAEGGFDVGLLTGDVTLSPGAQVLVMTTEILRNAIFEDAAALSDVEYAVFDEVHFLDDQERGSVWEEALIFAPPSMRLICLSATVANIEELGAWLREVRPHELEVIQSDRRPVPLHHLVYNPREGLLETQGLGQAQGRARGRLEGERRTAERHKGSRRGRRGRRAPRPRYEVPDPSPLLDRLQAEELLPALVFAFSRKDCARLARRNEGRDLLTRSERDEMRSLQERLVELFRLPQSALSGEIFTMARNGIGYHHAGLLPIDKELVERMFTSGLLKLLFTTETFALGINMPARTVVFHNLEKFDGTSVEWLRTREYLQMAGRAGRQGIDREGLVVSVVGDRELALAPFQRIFSGRPEPVTSRFDPSYSSLLHLVSALSREQLPEAWERSFYLFQQRAQGEKSRQRTQRQLQRLCEARLNFLSELGYLDEDDRITARGRIARWINGYEVQVTELAFAGLLEDQPPAALGAVFVALTYEERRRGVGWTPERHLGRLRRDVSRFLAELAGREAACGVPTPFKQPDWGLTTAVLAWCEGSEFEELEELTEVSPGDLCRSFRMALQLMRQTRRAIDPAWDLADRLKDAIAAIDRDEVDARRQLELG